MDTFKTDFPFDTAMIDRLILTYDEKGKKFLAAIRIKGFDGKVGVYSSGQTPQAAVDRALESVQLAERWRPLRF